jgi:hypothetical protein
MQLHVTNVFQRNIASLLFAPISQHNDRLRFEPPLIAHFGIKPFPIMSPKFWKKICTKNCKIVTIF